MKLIVNPSTTWPNWQAPVRNDNKNSRTSDARRPYDPNKNETGCCPTNRPPANSQLCSGFWLSAVAAVVLAFLCFVVEEAAHTAAGAGTAFLRLRL